MVQKMTIGQRIKEERERLGLSQEAFAQIGGVSKRSQIMYEQDKTEAGAGYCALIAQSGVDMNYILTGVRVLPLTAQAPARAAAGTVVPPESLVRKREMIKAMVDQLDDEAKLGAVQAGLEEIERVKRIERRLTELEGSRAA